MPLYEVTPSMEIDYYRVRLSLIFGKWVEVIYYNDPERQAIRMFVRTAANPNTLRQFFAVKEVTDDDIPVPKYVAEVTLRNENDFYAPIMYHDMSSFVLDLPEGYQLRIWLVYDDVLVKALRSKLDNVWNISNRRLTVPQQVALSMLRGSVYLVKIYILGNKKSEIANLVSKLSNFIVPMSGSLTYRIYKVGDSNAKKKKKKHGLKRILAKLIGLDETPKKKKWIDKMPKIGYSDLLTELRLWLWTSSDYFNIILTFPKTGKVKLSSAASLPYVKYDRKDFVIGRDLLYDEDVYLDWTDFQRHALILGSTGSGKSNTLEILAQELMKYGIVVFVDPNSQSARKLSKLAKLYFTIGGPNQDPNFGINILKVPPYFKNRDEAVDYVVDKAEQLFKRMLNLTDNAVYVSFVVKVVLRALLKKHDEITFEDFYETLLALWNEEIDINELLDPEDRRAASELEFLQGLQSQTFASVLARLEDFVNNRKFKIITSQNTIDWDRIVQITGGKGLVVFDVGKGTNEALAISVMGLIAISLFNYVYLMDALRKDHPPIFLIVDEAHNITHFDFIPLIFKEARKYKLHMILATQSLASIINTAGTAGGAEINNNTNVKILMKVNDALEAKLESDAIGGKFADRIRSMLPELGIGQAFLFLTPRPGEVAAPKLVQIRKSDLELKEEAEPSKGFEPNVGRIPRVGHPVRMFFSRDYPFNPVQQLILYKLQANKGMIDQATLLKETGLDRDRLSNELQKLVSNGIVTVGEDKNTRTKVIVLNDASWVVRGLKAVAPSQDGMMIAATVLLIYIGNGYYVIPVRQSPDLKYRPDLVAVKRTADNRVDYNESIAIEVESPNELTGTPEQVAKNMRKYAEQEMQVFKEVHFWTVEHAFPKLKEIYEKFMADPSVPEDVKRKVKIFALRAKPEQQQNQQGQQEQQNAQAQGNGGRQSGNQNQGGQGKKLTVPEPAVEIKTASGKTFKVYKYSNTLEIDGKKFRLPQFEIKRILDAKDMIRDVGLVENGKKIIMRFNDGSESEIIPLSSGS